MIYVVERRFKCTELVNFKGGLAANDLVNWAKIKSVASLNYMGHLNIEMFF